MSAASDRLTPYITKAAAELRHKTLRDIQIETALTWCGRACAAALSGTVNGGADAIEYAHEAIEHAALSGSDTLLRDVRAELRRHGVFL